MASSAVQVLIESQSLTLLFFVYLLTVPLSHVWFYLYFSFSLPFFLSIFVLVYEIKTNK